MNQANEKDTKPAVVQTVSLYEKHKKVYPRSVTGLFANWRWGMVWFTQLIFYGTCWLEWNGRQAVLFHVVERKFYLFGLVLWPQDVLYLAILLIISAYALFLVTAIGGRLFCGYVCPQTVYTEILLWIETKIEGERPARMKLDKGPRDARWWRLKATKHALWILVAVWTGFSFVGYFTPIRELVESAKTLSFGPWEWFWIFFYAGFLYMQAGFLREQVCKYMCPYARFQGVMFDPDTLIISYDPERGETRGARKKGVDYKAKGLGDCVDCTMCVQVCPTGIDIRKGLQYECIACAACIDACDEVMDKVGYPKGLIRYDTQHGLEGKAKHVVRPRTIVYATLLTGLILGLAYTITHRNFVGVDVLRDRNALFRERSDGLIENVYNIKILNKDDSEHEFRITASGLPGLVVDYAGPTVWVGAGAVQGVPVRIRVPRDQVAGGADIEVAIEATDRPDLIARGKARFIAPTN